LVNMDISSKIYVAGHRGLVGSAIVRRLRNLGFNHLILRTHRELDLTRQSDVEALFEAERPEYVFLAAAKVGGIWANNTYPAAFIYENLTIQTNIIHAASLSGVKKLLFLGSSCIYPKLCPQPMKEEHLLSGYLEPTNEPYAVAKIAGVKMCQAYHRQYGMASVSVMPTNLYGPNDNFDLETSHVLPALIRKFHLGRLALQRDTAGIERDQARFGPIPEDLRRSLLLSSMEETVPKGSSMSGPSSRPEVVIWGSGTPKREFLHVDDLADACLFVMNHYDGMEILNVGVGKDITIRQLTYMVAKIVGYEGGIRLDETKPDGTPQKLLDVSRLRGLGWEPRISLEEGIRQTYLWYREQSNP
jgi:GDP-L-fucose synthase